MQVPDVLVGAAIGDQTVPMFFQVELLDQLLDGLEKIVEEIRVVRGQIDQALERSFRHQQDVERIARFGMVTGEQSRGFVNAFDGKQERHMGNDPEEQGSKNRRTS